MRFEAHWNFSEISVEFSASLETSGIAVEFHRNSTDFFSRAEIRTWIWAIFGIVWRKTNIVKVTSLKIFSDFQDEKI